MNVPKGCMAQAFNDMLKVLAPWFAYARLHFYRR